MSAPMEPGELARFASELAARKSAWRHLVRHADDMRVYELLWSDTRVNAWLICWSAEQDTGFHDHDLSSGAIELVSGRLREERLALGAGPVVREYEAGSRFSVPASAIHRVVHGGGGPAVSIHAYSPPLQRMGAYRVGEHGALEREAVPCDVELPAEPALA